MSGMKRVSEGCKPVKEPGARKPYVRPKLARREKLIEVTESQPMVITP